MFPYVAKKIPAFAAVTLLLLSSGVQSQQQGVEVRYDKFKDNTDVTSETVTANGVALWVTATFPGSVCHERPKTGKLFFLLPPDSWPSTVDPTVILLLNDSRVKLTEDPAVRFVASTSFDGRSMNAYRIVISLTDIGDIAKGKSLEMKLGTTELALTPAQIKTFGAFVDAVNQRCS